MLKYIDGIRWVGDLSIHDADVLAQYGKKANKVFEHGAGGSTMILGQTSQQVLSLEEMPKWHAIVSERINNLGLTNVTIKQEVTDKDIDQYKKFDLLFIDGDASKRFFVIKRMWPFLSTGGYLLMHDTREFTPSKSRFRREYFDIPGLPYEIASMFRSEIENISFNIASSEGIKSNITVITKAKQPFYENWQLKENRPAWSYGSDTSVKDKFLLSIQAEIV